MRSIEFWEPPWLLNQSANEMESKARTSRMPPSGSINARTIGDVPSANELATCPQLPISFQLFRTPLSRYLPLAGPSFNVLPIC